MIEWIAGAALFLQAQTSQMTDSLARKPDAWCRGIHMPGPNGGANLLWTTVSGPEDRLRAIGEQMKKLGAMILAGDAPTDMRIAYRDDLDVKAIGFLLNDIDAGKFGQVTTKDLMMPLESLPADKCIRFKAKP
jgi:hypothetical protein